MIAVVITLTLELETSYRISYNISVSYTLNSASSFMQKGFMFWDYSYDAYFSFSIKLRRLLAKLL